MDALQARVNSFKKSKRVKNPSKPSSTTNLKWPHPLHFKANPESLAEAGFYYDPSFDDPDNVTCYVCEKELGGWEEEDDPFLIHWTKCGQTCCWASARCGLTSDLDGKGRFVSTDKSRIPTHKSMEKARHDTYSTGKGWIHDKTPNHGANSKMMARAGFVYTPQHNGDDLATCFYCNLSLSGWDEGDDPLEEHRKRDNKMGFPCAFFAAASSEMLPSTKPNSRAQSSKPPSKSQAKPPSRSTSRSKHQDVIQPTKTFDGELEDESDAPTTNTAPITKTPGKGRSNSSGTRKSSAKTPGNKIRSSSRSGLKNVVEEEVEEEEEDAPPVPQPPTTKKNRTRSKSVVRSEAEDAVVPDDADLPVTRKPSRSRSKKAISDAEEEIPRKTSRSKSKSSVAPSATETKPSRSKSKSKILDSEQEEVPPAATKTKQKAKAIESEQEENGPGVTKTKHTRTTSRAKTKSSAEASDIELETVAAEPAPKKKNATKSKPQAPAAQNLFDDDVFTDHYVPPLAPYPPTEAIQESIAQLQPLFIPKRTTGTKSEISTDSAADTVHTEKQKKTKPKFAYSRQMQSEDEDTQRPPSIEEHKPLAPVSANPSPVPNLKTGAGKQKLKVVEISSDEEPQEKEKILVKPIQNQDKENSVNMSLPPIQVPPPQVLIAQPDPPTNPVSAQPKRQKKSVIVETVQPIQGPRSSSPKPQSPLANGDVSMEDIDPEHSDKMQVVPVTPPRAIPQRTSSEEEIQQAIIPAEANVDSAEAPFIPPLSKLPFTPLHALSEPELDMTVEEWIRYQMDVEFDKFKRDGERELQRFRKRAEEVRKVIEGL
ncbi:Protein bir1 [Psilocybe cubensis]|uniref:Protein bir1 n=2 Tax=Psilocybe cubensis TaxID=181762 RepID=A0ACB8GUA9_PSICU|nr:Protein bir1 [Psilocybe cubensis]KAH9479320.1 Protein bir1 [Psilocybe cubensis]